MKRLVLEVREHLVDDFDAVVYGGTALLLCVLLWMHYGMGWLDLGRGPRSWVSLWRSVALYAVPWCWVFGLLWWRGRVQLCGRLFGAVGIGLLALGVLEWWPFHHRIARFVAPAVWPWIGGVTWNLKSCLVYLVPLGLFWGLFDRQEHPLFYGWNLKVVDLRPYRSALLGLVVVAGLASFNADFRAYYPTYQPGTAAVWLGVHPWVTFLSYELSYGLQFAAVETFFRGFFVVGMARWLGRSAVLPMVTIYCILHLGKPFGEAVTSIFGGYALGVWAYRHRGMIEGIALHLALAWAMDGFAYLQFLWRR